MTERRLATRAFQVAIWVTVGVIVVFSPLVLIGLGWFLEAYEEVAGAAPISHHVHEISFGILFALALVGALMQRRQPGENIAGMQQLVVATFIFTAVMWLSADRIEWLSVVYLAPVAVAAALHPARRRLLWPPPRPHVAGLALTAVALLPVFDAAGSELEKAANQAQNHTTHWGAMAAFFLTLLALSLLASLRPPGYRVTASSIGGAIILYGVASLVFPFDASAHPSGWAMAAIVWGLAWIGLAALSPRVQERKARERTAARTALTALGAFAAVIVAFVLTLTWATGDDPANIPHTLDVPYEKARPATCQECHATGQNGAPQVPHDFPRDGQASCLACHQYDPSLIESVARTPGWTLALPTVDLTGHQLQEVRER